MQNTISTDCDEKQGYEKHWYFKYIFVLNGTNPHK